MAKQKVRFASAGVPIQCKGGTLEAVECSSELGLGALEIEFVRGVKMKRELGEKVGGKAKELDVVISSHAPYYINCCTQEKAKLAGTLRHLASAAEATYWCGGWITVFHPGYYQKLSKEEAYKAAKKTLKEAKKRIGEKKVKGVYFGAETVGKKSAFGGLDEVVRLAQELDSVWPVVDFAHLLARGDFSFKNEANYLKVFSLVEKKVHGYGKKFHAHFSSINYTEKGEKNHLPVSANKPPYKPLMKVLAENGFGGTIVCESPRLEFDALVLQKEYLKHV